MRYVIPIHSIVDVITNSSSVIYTEAHGNSIKMAKAIINDVLKVAGSDKTADDLFNFTVQSRPDELLDYICDRVEKEREELEGITNLDKLSEIEQNYKVNGWNKTHELRNEWEKENHASVEEWASKAFEGNQADPEAGIHSYLVVTTKDGVEINFANNALSMFDIEASYNG